MGGNFQVAGNLDLILFILVSVSCLSIKENVAPLVFKINAGCLDLLANVSQKIFINRPISFRSSP